MTLSDKIRDCFNEHEDLSWINVEDVKKSIKNIIDRLPLHNSDYPAKVINIITEEVGDKLISGSKGE